jgi:hypothetical protein
VFDYAPSAAQTLMLEYAEGKKQVGWGRVSAADLELIGTLHAMKGDLLQRPAPLGAHGATRQARRMLDGIERTDGPKLTVLVGHDTNIGDLSGLLDFDFQVMGYAANTAARQRRGLRAPVGPSRCPLRARDLPLADSAADARALAARRRASSVPPGTRHPRLRHAGRCHTLLALLLRTAAAEQARTGEVSPSRRFDSSDTMALA